MDDIVRTDHIEGHETKEYDRSDDGSYHEDDADGDTVTPQAKRRRIQEAQAPPGSADATRRRRRTKDAISSAVLHPAIRLQRLECILAIRMISVSWNSRPPARIPY